jgi:hypothetical protein
MTCTMNLMKGLLLLEQQVSQVPEGCGGTSIGGMYSVSIAREFKEF